MKDLDGLIARVEQATGPDNALDIAIDITLFRPDDFFTSVRTNAAGTKLIYTRHSDGRDQTVWADDHTLNEASRARAVKALRSLQSKPEGDVR